MKKLLSTLLIVLFTAACTPTAQPQNGMMCDQCPCCQKMMEGSKMQCPMMRGDTKDGMKCCCGKKQCPMMQDNAKDSKGCPCCKMMKDGKKQCPMMQGKDGKPCSCCQKMMKDMKKDDSQSDDESDTGISAEDHAKHHPAQ